MITIYQHITMLHYCIVHFNVITTEVITVYWYLDATIRDTD